MSEDIIVKTSTFSKMPTLAVKLPLEDEIDNSVFTSSNDIQASKSTSNPTVTNVLAVKSKMEIQDYKPSSSDDKNGEIDNFKQNSTGDCAFLASIASLSHCEEGQKIIKDALEYQEGKTIVHLKGAGDYEVTDAELADVRKQNGILTKFINKFTTRGYQYSSGDDDMLIFELALGKAYDDIINGKMSFNLPDEYNNIAWAIESSPEQATTLNNPSIEGSFPIKVWYLLTGKIGEYTHDSTRINEILDLYENDNSSLVATPVSSFPNGGDRKRSDGYGIKDFIDTKTGEKVELIDIHGYSLKKVEGDNVTFINPWDSSKDITLSRKDVCENFYFQACDLSENNPELDYINHNDNYSKYVKEEIDGIIYNTQIVYDKDGFVAAKKYKSSDNKSEINIEYDTDNKPYKSSFVQYDDKGQQASSSQFVNLKNGLNIINRGLLDSRFSDEELMADFGISSLTDEQWQQILDLTSISAPKKELSADEITRLAKLDDKDTIYNIFLENPKANRDYALYYFKNQETIINDMSQLDKDDLAKELKSLEKSLGVKISTDGSFLGGRDYSTLATYVKKISDELGQTGLNRLVDRNLLFNTQSFDALDVYYLSFIEDDKWEQATELMQVNPDFSGEDVYYKLYV